MSTTVDELIEILQGLSHNGMGKVNIILSKDEEGNGYHHLDGYSTGRGEGVWDVEYYDSQDEEFEESDGDFPVVVLWP